MTGAVEILLRNDNAGARRMRETLLDVFARYDLGGWMFTRTIAIDEYDMPHSHPVLTLNTESAHDEVMVMAEFIHEQLHWFEEQQPERRERAIEATRRHYPVVPTERPEGAGNEYSTRLHLLVCLLEYQALKVLTGVGIARATIDSLSRHHYCWVYRTVLSDEATLTEIVRAHEFLPAPLALFATPCDADAASRPPR